jgi:sRNA-binding regulator protein Hfq
MPKQVHAEEIERFLGTVDGVASVRLLTSPSGEIDQIYVTADDATESRAARRAIVAALMTTYGIPIEPWRVQVVHLKGFPSGGLRNLKVVRVEETLSATETVARVQVAWEGGGERRVGTGQAGAPAGAAHRQQALAAATIDAVRAVVEPAYRRIAVQQVSLTTCMGQPLVLVGITASSDRGQEMLAGAAFEREGVPAAAVTAALDAVAKWLLHASVDEPGEGAAGDRRAHLEAMRHFAHLDSEAHPAPPALRAHAQPVPPSLAVMNPDVIEDLQEIRPEQKGGAAMATQHESSRAGVASPRPTRQTIEEEFYQPLIEARTPVHIRCRDGYEIPHAVLRDIGTYTLLVEIGGVTELLYKHAIISIRPRTTSSGG